MDLETEAQLRGQQAGLEFAVVMIARILMAKGTDVPGLLRRAAEECRDESSQSAVTKAMASTLQRLASECERG